MKPNESSTCKKIKASDETYCSTFDLQKALPFLSFQHSKLIVNTKFITLGVCFFNNNVRYVYVWDEIEGGGACQDVSSNVAKHLR